MMPVRNAVSFFTGFFMVVATDIQNDFEGEGKQLAWVKNK